MKITIISDRHGNYDAWSAFPEKEYDELWVLGDLVNYGPQSCEAIDAIVAKASLVVQGNHDYAVWEDGEIELKFFNYPISDTVAKLKASTLPDCFKHELSNILMTGTDAHLFEIV